MKYMLTIFEDENAYGALPPGELSQVLGRYQQVSTEMRERGVYVHGEGLQPTPTATTVRVRGGERLVTDGPFADTKEQLGGFYVLECEDLDEALDWAARLPASESGCIEVRPVMAYERVEA